MPLLAKGEPFHALIFTPCVVNHVWPQRYEAESQESPLRSGWLARYIGPCNEATPLNASAMIVCTASMPKIFNEPLLHLKAESPILVTPLMLIDVREWHSLKIHFSIVLLTRRPGEVSRQARTVERMAFYTGHACEAGDRCQSSAPQKILMPHFLTSQMARRSFRPSHYF